MSENENFQPGDRVEVQDAFGEWVYAIARSAVEGTHKDGRKIHDFPVVWVSTMRSMKLTESGPVFDLIPWPLESIRRGPDPVPDDMNELRAMLEKFDV